MENLKRYRSLGRAWILLSLALALHILDEPVTNNRSEWVLPLIAFMTALRPHVPILASFEITGD
jgi:hypothetical protein